jgi:hypothetical protein
MEEETEFILQCNPANSFIEQILFSKNNLDTSFLLNLPLLFCLAPESLEAGKRFFDEIRWTGKAEGYLLAIILGEHKHFFSFAGVQLRSHIIIVAHTAETLSEETTQNTEALLNEEIQTALGTSNAGLSVTEEEQREVTVWDLMEEMSRLNNELINTKRELVRKNVELERLKEQLKKG